ncbi:MAG: putative aspartyl protease [Gammaproteobacteria bacterium]|jgi:predicted aspartyl protease
MKIKLLLFCLLIHTSAQAIDVNVPIDKSQSGSLYVEAVINSNIRSQFLVDTGAGMIILNRELFEQISESGKVQKTGKIAARLANGKYETMNLYKLQSFSIGENCNLGEMEVAVMKHAGRNILGLSALSIAAPFAVHIEPLELVLSGCPFYVNSITENRISMK